MRYRRQNQGADGLLLVTNAVQSGSAADGSVNGVSAAGQSKSQVSQDNFINFCKGKTLTNGLQVQEGSCNGIPMGNIPSKQNMVSSIITFPIPASATIVEKTDFEISVQMINLVAGSFTNAQLTYYSAPQALQEGKVIGHTHVTIQDMGPNLNPQQPLDATKFVFFKGINDAGDGNGLLSAKVPGGLPAGNYRVCTMASASNHQLVLMPVAQRGAQDDCTKFTVIAADGGGGNGGNGDDAQEVSTTSVTVNFATSISEIESSTSVSVSIAETSPAETSASETSEVEASTTESTIETSITESLPILSSSPPPFANTSFVAAKTTTTRGRGNGKSPKTKTTTAKLSTTTSKDASTKVAAVALSTTKSVVTSEIITTTAKLSTTTSKDASTKVAAVALSTTKSVVTSEIITTSTSLVASSVILPTQTTTRKAGNNGGKNNNSNTNIKVVNKQTVKIIKIVHKITIIRTFFTFRNSLGGMPPAVNKKGNLFAVVDQLFDSLSSACDAACGAQYKTCISFTGPGFEVVKCKQQRKECSEAAKVVTSSAAEIPKTVTATVTVPPSASVPGQIIGEETVISTVQMLASSSSLPIIGAGPESALAPVQDEEDTAEPSATQEEEAAIPPTETTIIKQDPDIVTSLETIALFATSEAACLLVTQTVTVDNFVLASPFPSSISTSTSTFTTSTPLPIINKPFFSNFTSTSTPTISANLPTPTPTLSLSTSSPTPPSSTTTSPSSSSTPPSSTTKSPTSPTPPPSSSKEAVANISAPAITPSNDRIRPFSVNGNTFTNERAAKQRSCDVQFNRCADAVNGGKVIGVLIGDCEAQKVGCGV